jgi:UDP-N-acetylmuramyl pentapeptide phosphotransferase/UDP-N-acetylglucosamine-1-phosphate transferase
MESLPLTADHWRLLGAIATIVLVSGAASAVAILLLRPLLQRYALAQPNARSSHKKPTAQGGGIAVIGVVIAVVVVTTTVVPGLSSEVGASLPLLLAAAALLAVIGAIDDIRPIDVLPRLAFQAVAVMIMLAALPPDLRVAAWLPWWIERAFLLIGALWFVNLTNFMDGIDWITVAEVVPVTGGIVLLGELGALPVQATMVAAALLGAMLGFAPFNRPIARLFLGDVGSLPIGLLLAWLLILLAGRGHLVAALLLPLYYVADATITLGWRLSERQPVWQAHRLHFYQRAVDRGIPLGQIVGRIFICNLALLLLAALTVWWPSFYAAAVAAVCGICIVAWLLFSLAKGEVKRAPTRPA